MSSRERRRWVIDRVISNARRERAARERGSGDKAPQARGGAGRKPPTDPRPK